MDQAFISTNSAMLAANRIYRFMEDVTLNGSAENLAFASALTAEKGTTVLYMDAGVTVSLTGVVAQVTGPNGAVSSVSGAGLRVPSSSTVVVTGGGMLLAHGACSAAGSNGEDGSAYESRFITKTGDGGRGGRGGVSGAAAIGGIGGAGGSGGAGGEGTRSICGDKGFADGAATSGERMGTFIALGQIRIAATSDISSKNGSPCGAPGSGDGHGNGGGGAGGGGGSGGLPEFAIGGGAGGGAGGGGGGGGGYFPGATEANITGQCGYGGEGGSIGGTQGAGGGSNPFYGGLGGRSGLPGRSGGTGLFYAGDAASIDCLGPAGTNRVAMTLNRHGALRRQLIVKTEEEVEVGRLEAYVGEPLPALNPDEVSAWGDFSGLYCRTGDDAEEKWYDGEGQAVKAYYECNDLGDVTLYVMLDDEDVVAIVDDGTPALRRYKTLAKAVASAGYGATITIVGDVTGENVKIPSGTTILIGENGVFRAPETSDLLYDYYKVRIIEDGGKTIGYKYGLDDDKVMPKVGDDPKSGTQWIEFVRDEDSGLVTSAYLNVTNAYEDLYYNVKSGQTLTNLVPSATWVKALERGTLRLEVPAGGKSWFYRILTTDHPDVR